MGFLFTCLASPLLAAALLLLTATYVWYKKRFTYWTKKGVTQAEPVIPFGNVSRSFLGQIRFEFEMRDLYNKFKDEKYVGIYVLYKPALLVIDPNIIRLVMIKDFDSFADRDITFNEKDPTEYHLININGTRWKWLRSKLSPVFTSGKLKMMFQTMQNCSRRMVEVLEGAAERQEILEMYEISVRYSTDIVASNFFGFVSDSQKNPDTVFRQMGHSFCEMTPRKLIYLFMYKFFPTIAKALRIHTGVQKETDFFRNLIKETIEYREKNRVVRNDFMQLMMEMMNESDTTDKNADFIGSENWKFTLDDVTGNCVSFYLAGMETSAVTLSFTLYELALNPEIQRRLQKEAEEAMKKSGGEFSYETISEMEYLNKVVSETLRMHSPSAIAARTCSRDYQLPDNGPVIEKGTCVYISTYALHHDPQYFPEPKRYDPERFSQEQKTTRNPYVYQPFGVGPRNCIASRMGLLQVKTALAYLMSRYSVERCEYTTDPVEYKRGGILLSSTTGIQLRLVKRT